MSLVHWCIVIKRSFSSYAVGFLFPLYPLELSFQLFASLACEGSETERRSETARVERDSEVEIFSISIALRHINERWSREINGSLRRRQERRQSRESDSTPRCRVSRSWACRWICKNFSRRYDSDGSGKCPERHSTVGMA